MSAAILRMPDGTAIAYQSRPGRGPTVLFLGGFRSAMSGLKATYLQRWCSGREQAFVRMDYRGHGESGGTFEQACFSDWIDDVTAVMAAVDAADYVLVGSSMGAWIATCIALRCQANVSLPNICGVVAVAGAADFTKRLLWPRLSSDERDALTEHARVEVLSRYGDGSYPITLKLLQDGESHLTMDTPLRLSMPLRLLHGTHDADVPFTHALAFLQHVTCDDATLTLIKHGDHRLSEPNDLRCLSSMVAELSGF